MVKAHLVILTFGMLMSCGDADKHSTSDASVLDSFQVIGLSGMDDLLNLQLIDDTTLVTFSTFGSKLKTFKKRGDGFTFNQAVELSVGKPFHTFWLTNSEINIVDGSNTYYRLDKNYQLLRSLKFSDSKSALKKDFIINGNKTIPIIAKGDTIVSTYYYKNYQDYTSYFKEPAIAESFPQGDSFVTLRDYFQKPNDLINHAIPFPKYCFHDNKILLIYPCYDTLYLYDRSSNKLTKHVIGNKKYSTPAHWNFKKMYEPDFSSYFTKYRLQNFYYHGIFYNPNSRHYLLYFKMAVTVTDKEQNPSPEDQKLQLLVLNESFEPLHYYRFTQTYGDPNLFLILPDKGIAMPVTTKENTVQNVTFHLYNY